MIKEHIVGKFDDELTRIKSEILEMGELVGNQIKKRWMLYYHSIQRE